MKKIPSELEKFAPFYHDIDLGGDFNTAPGTYRIENAVRLFFPSLLKLSGGSFNGKRILDIGCNCGGLSIEAAKLGAKEVVGIDARKVHIDQANAIKDYLKLQNVNFYTDRIENISTEKYGEFDICILAGIIYHLRDPISAMEIVSKVTKEIIMVDSHVHYSSDTIQEDIPSWWMLVDTDMNDFDGLYSGHERLNIENYTEFENNNLVDYKVLDNQFKPSPHTERDILFSREVNPSPAKSVPVKDSLLSIDTNALSMVPNKKALIKLLRWGGFDDIIEIIPHRFSEEIYIRKIRVGLIALKKNQEIFFKSEWDK